MSVTEGAECCRNDGGISTEYFIEIIFKSPIELPTGKIKGKILHNGNQVGELFEVYEGNIIRGILSYMPYLIDTGKKFEYATLVNNKDDFIVQIENEEEKIDIINNKE